MQISNIDVSLSQGQLLNKKIQYFFVYLLMALCCLMILLLMLLLILVPRAEWDIQFAGLEVLGNCGSVALLSVSIFIICKDKKIKSKIQTWLEDAVEIKAYSKKIGENRVGIQPKATKIQVQFTLNGIQYRRDSTAKVFGGWEGYIDCFNRYADKDVTILYSPKYDEVLILKD